jgi:hypothetical protein
VSAATAPWRETVGVRSNGFSPRDNKIDTNTIANELNKHIIDANTTTHTAVRRFGELVSPSNNLPLNDF